MDKTPKTIPSAKTTKSSTTSKTSLSGVTTVSVVSSVSAVTKAESTKPDEVCEEKIDETTKLGKIKANNIYYKYMENFVKHYKLLPYINYNVKDIDRLFVDSNKKSYHISQYLRDEKNWGEVYLHSIGKMISILEDFAFPELENLSFRFILLFTIESSSEDFMKERHTMLNLMPFSINSNHEYNMESFIFFFYRCYGLIQTFLGVTLIFFVFLRGNDAKFSEQSLKRSMKKYIIEDENAAEDSDGYHVLDYLNLVEDKMGEVLEGYSIEKNMVAMLKKLVEYFLKVKIEADFEEKDLGDIIEKYVSKPDAKINIKDFDMVDMLKKFPEFYSPVRCFYQLVTGRFLEDEEDALFKEKILGLLK